MAVGIPIYKQDVDNTAGTIALRARELFAQVSNFKSWLDTKTIEDLEALGYTDVEAALLKDSFTDLNNLGQISIGQRTQAQANDFFWNVKHLWGLN